MATKKSTKLGPRATVLFKSGTGRGNGAKSVYVYMRKFIADKMGFKIESNATVTRKSSTKTKGKQVKVSVRGSKGAKHIKVLIASGSRGLNSNVKGVKRVYYQIPVPASATILDIKEFLKKAKQPIESFASPWGIVYSIEKGKSKTP